MPPSTDTLEKNMLKQVAITTVFILGVPIAGAHSPPGDARVFIIEPADGAVVTSPVIVRMGIDGFGITPAG